MATANADVYSVPAGTPVSPGRFAPGGTTVVSGGAVMSGVQASGTVAAYSAPPPSGNITQYLTSDGGTANDSANLSSPTKTYWHQRLGFPWKRTNGGGLAGRGNWLDSALVQEGSTAWAATAAVTAVNQVLSATVTSLVQRWMTTGQNKGFYLNARVNAFSLYFYGRSDPTPANRPELTVVTTAGTFVLACKANACWNNSSFLGFGTSVEWTLAAGSGPAILRFDLGTVTGTVTSATLTFKIKALSSGQVGHIIDVFELDPPTIIVPENVVSPQLGLAANYTSFNAMKAANLPTVKFMDDFRAAGPLNAGFVPAATLTLDPITNTTVARGTIEAGAYLSLSNNVTVVRGTGAGGAPDVIYDELYAQFWLLLEQDFGTTADTAIKVPALSGQFGYWNPNSGGYWQVTTGNGGSPSNGKKIAGTVNTNNLFEYQGHSTRSIIGPAPTAVDDDPYTGWLRPSTYMYHLDQGGLYPAGDFFPMTAIRADRFYCWDFRYKQNTLAGSQDSLGNYSIANADGIYEVWINGLKVYSRTNYRWRFHPEIGVQSLWFDVYHGGTIASPTQMHYKLDRASISTQYIGPSVTKWPFTIPATGNVGAISTNTLLSMYPAAGSLQFNAVLGAYCGSAVSLIYTNGLVTDFIYWIFGGGHGDSGLDGVWGFRGSTGTFQQFLATTKINAAATPDTTYGEISANRPDSQHTYDNLEGLNSDELGGPALLTLRGSAVGLGFANSGQAHKFDLATWSRYSNLNTGSPGVFISAIVKDTDQKKFIRYPSDSLSTYYTLDYNTPGATWQTLTQTGRTGNWSDTYGACGVYDPVAKADIAGTQRGVGSNLRFIQSNNRSGAWTELTFTNTGPTALACHSNSLQYRAANDTFLLLDVTTQPPNGIWVLTPDRTGPISAARPWTWSRLSYTGASTFGGIQIFSRMQYIPGIDAVVMCPNSTNLMEMWKL